MGVGTWSPRPHLDLARLLAERSERDRLQGELREHGSTLSCVNAAGNPLHPAPAARTEAQDALRGAIELAALLGVDTVVTMSGCPGGRDGTAIDGRLRRLLDLLRRRAALGVAVPRAASPPTGATSRPGRARPRPAYASASSCTRA